MAGLFSLIYFALVGSGAIVESAKTENYKIDSKANAIRNGSLTYTDGRGNEYFVETNTLCEKVQDKTTGHWILRELNSRRIPTGRVLYDFDKYKSLHERNELSNMIAKAKERNMRYFFVSFPCKKKYLSSTECLPGYDIEKERRYITYKRGDMYYCTYMKEEPTKYKESCNFTIQERYEPSDDEDDTFRISKEQYRLMRKSIK